MFFKTESEIEKALSAFGQSLESVKAWERPAAVPGTVVVQTSQDVAAIHWLAAALPTWFSPAQGWLLWISQSGIFRSELWHLYYLVRTSHGDRHDIRSAPGHHFLAHESAELHSVLFLAIASGWDAHLFALGGPGRAFVSHDGWFRVDLEATIADKVMADLDDRGADYSLPGKPRMV